MMTLLAEVELSSSNDSLVAILFTIGLIAVISVMYKWHQTGKATGEEYRCTRCNSGPLKESRGENYKTFVYCPKCSETTYTGTWS